MIKIVRTDADAPECLTQKDDKGIENWEKWGIEWQQKKAPRNWDWHVYKGENVGHLILAKMRIITNDHCCFCDKYAPEQDQDTIEHFKPKAQYPLDAFRWSNLFLCCVGCQKIPKDWKKIEQKYGDDLYEKLLLKPDEFDYDFHRYFRFDTKTGNVEILDNLSENDKCRATLTQQRYRFNEDNRPRARKNFFKAHFDITEASSIKRGLSLNDVPYRFIFM